MLQHLSWYVEAQKRMIIPRSKEEASKMTKTEQDMRSWFWLTTQTHNDNIKGMTWLNFKNSYYSLVFSKRFLQAIISYQTVLYLYIYFKRLYME